MKHREQRILIEFKGEISPENRGPLLRRVALGRARSVFLLFVPVTVLTALIALDFDRKIWLCFVAASVVLNFLGSILTYFLTQTKREQLELFPNRICFLDDQDHTVLIEGPRLKLDYYLEDFPKIVDKGAYYLINVPAREGWGVICQKNLMVQGSIEEFETLFGDKLERENP